MTYRHAITFAVLLLLSLVASNSAYAATVSLYPSNPTISYGQSVSFNSFLSQRLGIDGSANSIFSTASSGSITLSTQSANDVIVLFVGFETGTAAPASVSSITDTAGLTWTRRSVKTQYPDHFGAYDDQEVWYAISANALSSDAITAHISNTIDDAVMLAFGLSGANTIGPWDPNALLPSNSAGASGNASVLVSTTDAYDLLLGFAGGATQAWIVTNGFSTLQSQTNTGAAYRYGEGVAYNVVTTAQSNTLINMSEPRTTYPWIMQGDAAIAANQAIPNLPYNAVLYSSSTSTCNSGSTFVQAINGIDLASANFNPVSPSSTTYYCSIVTNHAGTTYASPTVKVAVAPTVSLSTSSAAVEKGHSVTLTASIQGGTGPFTVNFIYTNNGVVANTVSGVAKGNSPTYSFLPTQSGTYSFNAVVIDTGASPQLTANSTAITLFATNPVLIASPPPALGLDTNGYCQTLSTTCTISLTTSNSNDILVVMSGGSFNSISSSPSLTWTQREYVPGCCGINNYYYYAVWDGSGSISITVTQSGSGAFIGSAFAISGAYVGNCASGGTSCFDSTNVLADKFLLNGPKTYPILNGSNSISTANPTDLIYGLMVQGNQGTSAGAIGNDIPAAIINTGAQQGAGAIGWGDEYALTTSKLSSTTMTFGTIMQSYALIADAVTAAYKGSATYDIGQTITQTAEIEGGTSPFTYNDLIAKSGSIVYNALYNNVASPENTISLAASSLGTGVYSYNVIVTDSANVPNTFNSPAYILTVDSAPSVSLSGDTAIDAGQTETLKASLSGGTGPFTVNFVYTNNGVVANTVTGVNAGGTANYIFAPAAGTYTYNAIATDTGTTTPYIFNSVGSTITVNNVLGTPTLTPSNPVISSGQSVTFTASWSGGTPTYGASLYSSSTSTCNQQSTLVQQQIDLTGSSATFNSIAPSQNAYYCVVVTDNAINPSNSVAITGGITNSYQVSFAPNGSYAYVADGGGNKIEIVSTATNTITGTITSNALNYPVGVAIAPSGTYAYVGNKGASNVLIVDTATNSVTGSINNALFDSPVGVAFSPSGSYAYVVGYNGLFIIDAATNAVVAGPIDHSSGGNDPSVAFDPTGTYAYLSNFDSNDISIMSTATNAVVGHVGGTCSHCTDGVSIAPSGTYAYALTDNNNIDIVNTATNTVVGTTANFLNGIYYPGFSPSGSFVYVSTGGSTLNVVNTNVGISNSIDSKVTFTTSSGGGGPAQMSAARLSDNINSSSGTPVFHASIINPFNNQIISSTTYSQADLPATTTFSSGDELRFSFACSFAIANKQYTFSGDLIGMGFVPCGVNYTVYGGGYEVLYSSSALQTSSTTTTALQTSTPTSLTTMSSTSTRNSTTSTAISTVPTTATNGSGQQSPGGTHNGAILDYLAAAIITIAVVAFAAYLLSRKPHRPL